MASEQLEGAQLSAEEEEISRVKQLQKILKDIMEKEHEALLKRRAAF